MRTYRLVVPLLLRNRPGVPGLALRGGGDPVAGFGALPAGTSVVGDESRAVTVMAYPNAAAANAFAPPDEQVWVPVVFYGCVGGSCSGPGGVAGWLLGAERAGSPGGRRGAGPWTVHLQPTRQNYVPARPYRSPPPSLAGAAQEDIGSKEAGTQQRRTN